MRGRNGLFLSTLLQPSPNGEGTCNFYNVFLIADKSYIDCSAVLKDVFQQ